jgi:hypothetical protein
MRKPSAPERPIPGRLDAAGGGRAYARRMENAASTLAAQAKLCHC